MLHELWEEDDGQTFCLAGSHGNGARALLSPNAELTWSVEAASHLEAMTAYHEHMGWSEYSTDFPELDGQLYAERGWEVTFTTRPDGQVDAALVGAWPTFNHALADCISSLPPRGEPGTGPSTYWIDVARQGAYLNHDSGSEAIFLTGNVTELQVIDDEVVARYDYDPPDGPAESISVTAFLALLEDWRQHVRASAQHCERDLAETYRRNPMPPIEGPTRGQLTDRWRQLIAGETTRESTAAWANCWMLSPRQVEAEMLVMSAVQHLDGFDMTHALASRNLVRHGGKSSDRVYYHSDDHVADELARWLDKLAEYDADPEGFLQRIRDRNRRS